MSKLDPLLLKQNHLFRGLGQQELDTVMETSRIINAEEGERIFHQGDVADSFYMVVKGNVKLFRVSKAGNEKVIQIVKPSQTFAEGVMFMENEEYPVNATAIGDTRLYRFQNRIFLQLLENSYPLCLVLFGDLSTRLHQMLNEVDRLSLQNARYRLVQYLDENMVDSSTNQITLDIDKKTIASRLSITPETLSRMLRELADEGLICMDGKVIIVPDRARLKVM